MVVEHAHVRVDPGRAAEFETAFTAARPIVASAQGWRSTSLYRDAEIRGGYLLQVQWTRLEDHTELFPSSAGGLRFAELVGRFFLDAPAVHHISPVAVANDP